MKAVFEVEIGREDVVEVQRAACDVMEESEEVRKGQLLRLYTAWKICQMRENSNYCDMFCKR